ncbi:MAG TPA: HAD-IIIC family phosphatase [Actinoplanes sp.]|nr:HAD-IIIC family phosphatase [Actinoplanes sp.]
MPSNITRPAVGKGVGEGSTVSVKCVVWDLDNTMWTGVLLEGDPIELRPGLRQVMETLDRRGILQSVASKNDERSARAALEQFGLWEFMLYPQIGWSSKSSSIRSIAASLNIGLDAIVFVDDDPFERDEVASEIPEVRSFEPDTVPNLLDLPEFTPRYITAESARRRQMYIADSRRAKMADGFTGAKEEFLRSLRLRFEIARAQEADLQRAEELTERTHQLNTTGHTYTYDELNALRTSESHLVLIARLADKFGDYGTIGLAVVEKAAHHWVVKLLLFSCRVTSRGVAVVLMNHLKRSARDAGVRLLADMIPTERNRVMYLSFLMTRFEVLEQDQHGVRMEADLAEIPEDPSYVKVTVVE